MKSYQTILFDLDGTLTDPGVGITNSVIHALEHYRIPIPEREKLFSFVGPPLIDSFEREFGFSRETATEAVRYYREYFKGKGIFENRVYDGVPDMLRALKESGKELLVATSKPENFAMQILEHFHLENYFSFVGGSLMDESRTRKDEVIAYTLQTCGIHDLSSVVMVGDREYDVLGAAMFGIDTVGVLYGYGSREELTKAGAAYLAETPHDVVKILQ